MIDIHGMMNLIHGMNTEIIIEQEKRAVSVRENDLLSLDGTPVPSGVYHVETIKRLSPIKTTYEPERT